MQKAWDFLFLVLTIWVKRCIIVNNKGGDKNYGKQEENG